MQNRKPDSGVLASAAATVFKKDTTSQHLNEEFSYIREVNVKADDDENGSYITGMTLLSSSKLILADKNNQSLKLVVDLENNVTKHSLRLQSIPCGITAISEDMVAVVLENKCKIQIVKFVSTGLSIERTVRTDGKCVDIKFVNDKFYVSYEEPVKFQSLRLTGAVHKSIKPDSEVLKHCTLPRHIAVSPDESMIYVSDWRSNKVLSLDMNGNMISIYQGELDQPHGITISPTGYVYLCNRNQHILYRMRSDLSESTVLLVQGDGLIFPQAMCFDVDKKQLYISSGSIEDKHKDFIKVFKI